jgi:hypothetical protein
MGQRWAGQNDLGYILLNDGAVKALKTAARASEVIKSGGDTEQERRHQ